MSRKQKGSRNREKARRKLARLHYHIACIRDDLLHKATTALAEQYGFIGVESLHVKGMMQNHAMAQALEDTAFGRFAAFLSTKVTARDGQVLAIGRFFPSSKTCSCCGHVKQDLTLSERIFVCPACGFTLDRDWNAAINILNEALWLSASSLQDNLRRPVVATTDAQACGQLVRPSVLQPSGCTTGGAAGRSRNNLDGYYCIQER
jgi:putative transposase